MTEQWETNSFQLKTDPFYGEEYSIQVLADRISCITKTDGRGNETRYTIRGKLFTPLVDVDYPHQFLLQFESDWDPFAYDT